MTGKKRRKIRSDATWESHFVRLKGHRLPDGTLYVPITGPGADRRLWLWCATQRNKHRQGRLDTRRAARLERAGFPWDVTYLRKGRMYGEKAPTKWEQPFQRLLDFKQQHGHCKVTLELGCESDLNRWIVRQRQQYREGTLRADRRARLEAVGVIWRSTHDNDMWERFFMELKKFKKSTGIHA